MVTGKPISLGGSERRLDSTARGCVISVREAAKVIKLPLKGATAAVQGYGNIGSWCSVFLKELGVRVLAVSDSKGGIPAKEELDPQKNTRAQEENGVGRRSGRNT